MNIKSLIVVMMVAMQSLAQPLPTVSSGKVERIENFPSEFVEPRHIDIWLPAGYTPDKKYAVLYMHDGQMLFDSSNTWNHQSWEADEVAAKLIDQGVVQEFIIVGIWNVPHLRHGDYFPQKPMESLTAEQIEFATNDLKKAGRITEDFAVRSDNYLKFVVTELKPVIDNKYAVYTDQSHTFVAGSSMGGLISMYALCEYPDVFGGAACLSTHWPGIFSVENNPIPEAFANYLSQSLPDPGSHLIYFDYGDQTLDALYPPLQAKIDSLMPLKGYSASQNWETNYFPGDDHSEKSWSRRLDVPFSFLLKPTSF